MSSDTVQKIKEMLSIEEVVGSYVKLDRAGRALRARCPFHTEKTPSFYVTPERGIFKCFGCGKGGDIFSFVQDIEGVDFYGALQLLAQKAGVSLTREQVGGNTQNILYEIIERAQKWYEVHLRQTTPVVEYLLSRGLTKETLVAFHVGYAPAGGDVLYRYLRSKGYRDADIVKTGLCAQGERGSYYDRFRERIMFPIMDSQGRAVAFSGRIFLLPGSNTDITATGKYVNSPEGPLYTKSNILFGYDKAKRSMLTRGRCILVEGQMDLLMAHQVGTTEAVALSGTALTAVQCNRMKRFTEVLILALDGDTAGIAAAERSVIIAYQEDMQVRVAIIPEGKDPADIIATDPQLWQDLIDHAKDYIEVRLDMIRSDMASASIHERYKALRDHVFPFINSVSNAILRDAYIQRIAGTLGVDATSVHQEYARWSLQHIQDGKIVSSNGGNISQQNTSKESHVSKKIHHENMRLSSRDQVIALIEYMRTSHPENAETAEQHFSLLYQNPDAYILALASIQEKIDDMITMIGIQYDTGDTLALILEHALRVLELDLLQEQYYQTRAQLASQQGGEYEKTVRMLEQINKKIDELKKLL